MIHLGFAVGTGEAVAIPLGHMTVCGQSQRAGKTTAMEALVERGRLRALAFVTKRGEGAFQDAPRAAPCFRERADWQFVASILESTMREKMRFERAWIVRAAKGAKTLGDVRKNIARLQEKSGRSMDKDVYMMLGEYLDLVVPLIQRTKFVSEIRWPDRMSNAVAMDLSTFPLELQMLVIQSSIDWVSAHASNTVVVVPEAWEFVPETRGSPVKIAVQALVRKGAAVGNFAWLDSQDLAGVSKEAVRQSRVWLLGVQREANEVRRTLAHIPAGIKKPKVDDVARLQRGQFYACWDDQIRLVYVQPKWMTEEDARMVATGGGTSDGANLAYRGRQVQEVLPVLPASPRKWIRNADDADVARRFVEPAIAYEEELEKSKALGEGMDHLQSRLLDGLKKSRELDRRERALFGQIAVDDVRKRFTGPNTEEDDVGKEDLERIEGKLDQLLAAGAEFHNGDKRYGPIRETDVRNPAAPVDLGEDFEEGLYRRFLARLMKEAPKVLRVLSTQQRIDVEVVEEVVEVDGNTLRGRLALLLLEGFFDETKAGNAAFQELARRGFNTAKPNVYREMNDLASMGFATKEEGGYRAVPERVKAGIKRAR